MPHASQSAAFEPIDLLRSFHTIQPSREQLLSRLRENVDSSHAAKSQPPREVLVDLPIQPEQARLGGSMQIDIPIAQLCPRCDGTGSAGFYSCDLCDGHGMEWRSARVSAVLSPMVRDGTIIEMSLSPFGMRNIWLRLRLRVEKWA